MYLKRCKDALKKYEKTHNQEFLIDAMNYCALEIKCPTFDGVYFESMDSAGRNINENETA